MTIDQRLEALTARHEALAQSVELLTLDVRELTARQSEHGERVDKALLALLEGREQFEDALVTLAKIAADHEKRLTSGKL